MSSVQLPVDSVWVDRAGKSAHMQAQLVDRRDASGAARHSPEGSMSAAAAMLDTSWSVEESMFKEDDQPDQAVKA